MTASTIRLFQPSDREAIRTIACETADRGEPVDHFFHDREVFADLLVDYYLAYEPGAVWVAEHQAEIVGYLTGCLDTDRYHRLMTWQMIPRAVVKAVRRGALWARPTWRLALAGIRTSLIPTRALSLDQYPAHLHVNLRHVFRGQHLGQQLVERFLGQAQTAHHPGVHAAVRSDNPGSCRFFERMGFVELGRRLVIFPEGATYQPHDTIIYGRRLYIGDSH